MSMAQNRRWSVITKEAVLIYVNSGETDTVHGVTLSEQGPD